MATERKPPPEGYVRHHLDPNLVRKIGPPPSAAQALFGHLPSAQEHSAKEEQKEKEWIERKGGKAR